MCNMLLDENSTAKVKKLKRRKETSTDWTDLTAGFGRLKSLNQFGVFFNP